jgi:cellulose synthase/poly-beta-1,6-N-acetylglucosamine synthase-like glycosyltransferase
MPKVARAVFLLDSSDHATCTLEPTPGPYAARNRGLELAKGYVIGFTDADCIPNPDWIEKGVRLLHAQPKVGLVGGKVEFFFRNSQKPSAAELFDSIRNLQQERSVRFSRFAVTANLFTFREVFDRVGGFDASLMSQADEGVG